MAKVVKQKVAAGKRDTKMRPLSEAAAESQTKQKKTRNTPNKKQKDAQRILAQEQEKIRAKGPKCNANKKDGSVCGLRAGFGTHHEGQGRCRYHGGATPSHELAVIRETVESMATPVEVTPGTAMAGVLNLSAGQLLYITAKVAALQEDDVMTDIGINPWIRVQWRIMDSVAKYAKLAADAGIDERLVSLAEEQTRMISTMLEKIATDLEFTPEQKQKLGPAIRKHLHALPQAESS